MSVLPIVIGQTTPVLRKKTERVGKVTKEILKMLKDMEETTVHASGLGIAAPQVDHSLRMCIVTIGGKLLPLIDPDILWKSAETNVAEEGCLSLPNIWLDIERSTEITLRYTDTKGKEQERKLKNIDARVVQHEVDHLDGILITDYPPAKKATALSPQ